VAADPARTAPPAELGRYYYYLGYVSLATGDQSAAGVALRRALDLAPGHPLAAVTLARQYAQRGSQEQAEVVLANAARIALEQGQNRAALRLQRELAQVQASAGDKTAAISSLRAIVATGGATVADRLALAEVYAQQAEHVSLAVEELREAAQLQPDHLPTLQRLVALIPDADPDAMRRALTALRVTAGGDVGAGHGAADPNAPIDLAARALTDELRAKHFSGEEVRGPFGQIWQVIHAALEQRYPPEPAPEDAELLQPAALGVAPEAVAATLGGLREAVQVWSSRQALRPAWLMENQRHRLILPASLLEEGVKSERNQVRVRLARQPFADTGRTCCSSCYPQT